MMVPNPFLAAARAGEDPRRCHLGRDPWDTPECAECEAYGEAYLAAREEQQQETDMSFLAVIDPNWKRERGGGKIKRGADRHYALASVDVIAAQYRASEPWCDVGPGLLWMWCTGSVILAGDAHAMARSLGFRPCAEWVWAKVEPADACEGCGGFTAECDRLREDQRKCCPDCTHHGFTVVTRGAPGLGQWSRKEHEHLWLCRRGDVKVPPPSARPRSVIYAPRTKHSAKPEAGWRVIETVSRAVLPGVVGVEWNARTRRTGWGAVGALDGEHNPIRFEPAGHQEEQG